MLLLPPYSSGILLQHPVPGPPQTNGGSPGSSFYLVGTCLDVNPVVGTCVNCGSRIRPNLRRQFPEMTWLIVSLDNNSSMVQEEREILYSAREPGLQGRLYHGGLLVASGGIVMRLTLQEFYYNTPYRGRPERMAAARVVHSTWLELVWTLTPLLVVGHQWYWEYQYAFTDAVHGDVYFGFDSYMIPEGDLPTGGYVYLKPTQP
ncbi:cox2 [Planoprotostelium fungivorum]|uniref:Cox2 (Mitochondrion) n=1 Tax=Planoprotostelium fungivorum TaxID=1890364 RepID=A0A2P6NHW9_9EUKA|nr:cox2 [Planoprotostelium fungivorum]